MSLKHIVYAFETKLDNPIRKLVLVKLADNANEDGVCWPSINTIAKHCECGRRTVIRHIQWLEENGFLSVKRKRSDKNKNEVNVYELHEQTMRANTLQEQGSATVAPPSATVTPPPSATVAPKSTNIESPIEPSIWQDFLDMRKSIKKPLLNGAISRMDKKLTKMHNQGHDINKCLEQSIINSWQDVYPLKDINNEKSNSTQPRQLKITSTGHNDLDW
jgi:hypothetical protein